MSAKADLGKFFNGLKSATQIAVNKQAMDFLANTAITLIVKRTRLGFGVRTEGGQRYALSSVKWSDRYARLRRTYPLDGTTAPGKHNLTLTGQMLRSVRILETTKDGVVIGPQGARDDGKTNEDIAKWNAQRGRVFMNLSQNEYGQLVRVFRRKYTALMKRLAKVR
jgi:hypothetical protein